ncbi:MAG: hypothetical protein DIU65_01010, partial [Proteobacteria bacterium]
TGACKHRPANISPRPPAGPPPDLTLHPKLGHVGMTEFHRADETIRQGYETTMAHLNDLSRLQAVLA